MRFSIGQRPQPGAYDSDAIDRFFVTKAPEARTPFGGHDSGGMVGESSEDGYVVSHARPMPRQLVGAGGWGPHFRRKVLRDVENFHDQ